MTHRESAATRLFHNARREAVVVLVVWVIALVWTVGVCYLRGYEHTADSWVVQAGLTAPRAAGDVPLVAGLPEWVLLGILLPWLLSSAFTAGFCVGMREDELGDEEGADHAPVR